MVQIGTKTYNTEDLALVVPTYNRPEKVKILLGSIVEQDAKVGRIIIVDGGESIRSVVDAFSGVLPVEYYHCSPPGQIRQRNLGISLLNERTPLVASMDDDIVLEPGALAAMIRCWNEKPENTAAVAFNIINNLKHHYSFFKALVNMSARGEGRVLKSGCNTTFGNTDREQRVQWVYGGATVWRFGVLRKYPHREIRSRWAYCEDLIYSYPIGKEHPLYVCAEARVRHEHVFTNPTTASAVYRGRNSLLWRLFFIQLNPELSGVLFMLQQGLVIPLRFIRGGMAKNAEEIRYDKGQLKGWVLGLLCLLRRENVLTLIKESDHR
ncbi:glycosyltransferase family 2 protein [Thermodesulfobacteriota bacterium]